MTEPDIKEIVRRHHNRHPWLQPGDRAERVWMLRFDDNDVRDMVWTDEDAEEQARKAYAKYSRSWNCYLFAVVPAIDPALSLAGERDEAERYAALGRACEANGLGWYVEDGTMRFQPPADLIAEKAEAARLLAEKERDELAAKLSTPELLDFAYGVLLEASHQRERWGADHDAGKEPEDWFWLLGYLGGKALRAAKDGDRDKALHHCISSAAALANWHAAILGANNTMRPGIDAKERGYV